MENRKTIKAKRKALRAKGHKVKIKDLIVQAEERDPYYMGSDAQIILANWIGKIWKRMKKE